MKFLSMFLSLLFVTTGFSQAPKELQLMEEYIVPAIEISGMAWRTNPESMDRELILVSDRDYALYVVDWKNRKPQFRVKKIDLIQFKTETDGEQSEWESVFSDESGRVYIVKENPGSVLILSKDLSKVEHRVSIDRLLSTDKKNSGSEGLFPLKNGHFIVVNEKDPLEIIEFGPSDEKSQGYTSSLNIESRGQFPMGKIKDRYSALHLWTPDSGTLDSLKDSSGINVDSEGRIYLLSDEERKIALLGNELPSAKNTFSATKYWTLPKKLKNPEGMVIDTNNQPIIAIDNKKSDKPNLFLLSPLN